MTTIFYDGRNLHADRRQVIPTYPARYSDTAIKLFVNKENTIAYGSTGDAQTKTDQGEIFDALAVEFKLVYIGMLDGSMKMETFPLPPALKDADLIAITREKALLFRDGFRHIQTSYSGAVGTGARSLLAIHYVLGDIAKSYEINNKIDTLSSPTHMSVMADTLNPYVVE